MRFIVQSVGEFLERGEKGAASWRAAFASTLLVQGLVGSEARITRKFPQFRGPFCAKGDAFQPRIESRCILSDLLLFLMTMLAIETLTGMAVQQMVLEATSLARHSFPFPFDDKLSAAQTSSADQL